MTSARTMTQPDFTFIVPNTRWHRNGEGRYWNHIPYPEGVLTAVLRREGYTVNHIDANVEDLSPADLARRVAAEAGRVVGVSAMSVEYKDAAHLTFRIVKEARPQTKTVIGGVYPSLSPEIAQADPHIDFIVISEGERRLVALMKALDAGGGLDRVDGLRYRSGGRWVGVPRSDDANVHDLDAVPFPDYSDYDTATLFNWSQKYTQNFQFRQLPMTILMTSRGCVYKCTYCGAGKDGNPINDGITRRSPENVLAEIDELVAKYGIREIVFVDDSLLVPHHRIISILKGMAERRHAGVDLVWKSNNLDLRHIPLPSTVKGIDNDLLYWMRESGCYQITISLESGSPETLKRMKRPTNLRHAVQRLESIREYGFDEVCSNFIIGMPGDTWDDILTTFEFADEMVNGRKLLDYALFSIFTPLPGTEAADQAMAAGYLPADFDPHEFYGFGRGIVTTDEFTPAELQMKRALEWDRINFRSDRPDHQLKLAKMLGVTLEQLNEWRRETRRSTGVQVKSADTTDREIQRPSLPNLFHRDTFADSTRPVAVAVPQGGRRLPVVQVTD
jgi:anaerobic magnesium-protoporphyrin IX monomethyl ester cyclase